MIEMKKDRNLVKNISFRILKSTVKAILVYLIYFLLTAILAPFLGLIPELLESIEIFVAVYVVLMILSDLTARTVFQHFFNTTKALFLVAYLLISMGDGVLSINYENAILSVNLALFYTLAIIFSLLGFAKTILQAISFMSEKAEAGKSLHL